MAYPNGVFSAFAFIGFLLVSIPLPWHLEAWNVGTCLYMIWTGLACLNQFINSLIWNGNAINWAPVWCDISTRFMIGSSVAIPAASLCINRRLYKIASVRSVTSTSTERRRTIMVDLAIGLGLPILEMVLQHVVQGHRFNIFEDIGCYPFTYNTPLAYVLVFTPCLVIGLIAGCYAVLSIIAFRNRHTEFRSFLSNHSNLSSNRYIRLMSLASLEVCCTVPLTVYLIVLNATTVPVFPWISWSETHFGFSRVDQIPSILWRRGSGWLSLEASRWLVVVCAFVFFGFFGFADEARRHYKMGWNWVAIRIGISTSRSTAGISQNTSSNTISTIKSALGSLYGFKFTKGFSISSLLSSTSQNETSLPVYFPRGTMEHDSLDSISTSDLTRYSLFNSATNTLGSFYGTEGSRKSFRATDIEKATVRHTESVLNNGQHCPRTGSVCSMTPSLLCEKPLPRFPCRATLTLHNSTASTTNVSRSSSHSVPSSPLSPVTPTAPTSTPEGSLSPLPVSTSPPYATGPGRIPQQTHNSTTTPSGSFLDLSSSLPATPTVMLGEHHNKD